MVAIHKIKTTVTLPQQSSICQNVCIKIKFSASLWIYYHYIKQKYDSKRRLLVADTDNLMHEIETYNVYDNFSKNKEKFGFSNHSSDSKYYNDSND